jgi:hypothetical protein
LVRPVRIDEVIYAVPRNVSERSRSAEAEFTLSDERSSTPPTAEDIVQLTLGHDGIWEVSAASPAADSTTASAYTTASTVPPMARLYHSFLRLYSPEGLLHAMEQSRGLMVDVYV